MRTIGLDGEGTYRWDDGLCLGVSEIDRQHQELFRIAGKIERLVHEYAGDLPRRIRLLEEAFRYLESYAREHFAAEESFQLESGYAGYSAHKEVHDGFLRSVVALKLKLAGNGYDMDTTSNFLEWFASWLYNHIMNDDRKIVDGRS